MKIIQIVGYKNSGKTTLSSHLIASFKKNGIYVASIKHHGHGGKPKGYSRTDSEKHLHAGANISCVAGENLLQLSIQKHWQLSQIIPIFQLFGVEMLVVEGFKEESYPKILLLRNKNEEHLLESITNIRAVMSWYEMEQKPFCPVFRETETADLCNWILHQFM